MLVLPDWQPPQETEQEQALRLTTRKRSAPEAHGCRDRERDIDMVGEAVPDADTIGHPESSGALVGGGGSPKRRSVEENSNLPLQQATKRSRLGSWLPFGGLLFGRGADAACAGPSGPPPLVPQPSKAVATAAVLEADCGGASWAAGLEAMGQILLEERGAGTDGGGRAGSALRTVAAAAEPAKAAEPRQRAAWLPRLRRSVP